MGWMSAICLLALAAGLVPLVGGPSLFKKDYCMADVEGSAAMAALTLLLCSICVALSLVWSALTVRTAAGAGLLPALLALNVVLVSCWWPMMALSGSGLANGPLG